jgi:hypothetical protein
MTAIGCNIAHSLISAQSPLLYRRAPISQKDSYMASGPKRRRSRLVHRQEWKVAPWLVSQMAAFPDLAGLRRGQVMKPSDTGAFITGRRPSRTVWRMFDRGRRDFSHRSPPRAIDRQVMPVGEARVG